MSNRISLAGLTDHEHDGHIEGNACRQHSMPQHAGREPARPLLHRKQDATNGGSKGCRVAKAGVMSEVNFEAEQPTPLCNRYIAGSSLPVQSGQAGTLCVFT
jgi:hypothetical protein